MATTSEQLFEQYCQENGIGCMKIKEAADKTPDYDIEVNGIRIIAEIKQIDPSKEDRSLIRELRENGCMNYSRTPGDRVRNKIKSASIQLSKLSKDRYPSMVVLYNNLPLALGNPIDPYNIRVGMYGLDTIVLSVPNDPPIQPSVIDRRFGPKRKMTETHNTSISAVAVLSKANNKKLWLDVYHNIYASMPIPAGLISSKNANEFILSEDIPGEHQEWVKENS